MDKWGEAPWGRVGAVPKKSHTQACLRLKKLILRVYEEPRDPLLGQADKLTFVYRRGMKNCEGEGEAQGCW